VVLLRKGELLQYETPQTLYHKPKDCYTASFFGKANLIHGKKISDNSQKTLQTIVGNFETNKPIISIRPEHIVLTNPENSAIKAIIKEVRFGGILQDITIIVENTVLNVKADNRQVFKKNEIVGLQLIDWIGLEE
jgi:ABC-type Fe3+/spermidine/putrescine transport system ATPase subunit